MTNLAYMVREDWAQLGTAMTTSSARIRDWLGDGPYLFAVTDVRKFNRTDHSADLEAAEHIAPGDAHRHVVNITDLARLDEDDRAADVAAVVLHPFDRRDCEALGNVLDSGTLGRMFVLIWSPHDVVRIWLEARGAVNLHIGESLSAPDPLQVAAAELMVNEQYNGLSSGRGEDAVVQLLRAFTNSGYPAR